MHDAAPTLITPAQHAVVRALKALDACSSAAPGIGIEIRNETGAYLGVLTPVTPRESQDLDICTALSRWRRMYKKYFLTQFEPNPQRTQRWLTDRVLPDDTRILFLIRDPDDRAVGNFGVCGIAADRVELDNLIRGEKGGDARLIYYAEIALLGWCYTELDVAVACLHVLHTNSRTLQLHQSVGFTEQARAALWQYESHGDTCLTTEPLPHAQAAGLELVCMTLTREQFDARYAWAAAVRKGSEWTH